MLSVSVTFLSCLLIACLSCELLMIRREGDCVEGWREEERREEKRRGRGRVMEKGENEGEKDRRRELEGREKDRTTAKESRF